MSLTVVHVVGSTRADHGGTSRSVPALCEALDAEGVEVHLVTAVRADPTRDEEPILPGGDVHVHRIEEQTRLQRTLRSPLGFYRRLWSVVEDVQPDVIHDHGAWLPSNVVAAWVARRANVPLVVASRGMVTEWSLSHKARKKQAAWHLYQKHVFRQASLFHATAPAEVDDLRALGMTQPIAVVPNGVEIPDTLPNGPPTDGKRALFLSRIHPKKGLPMLLDAWAALRPEGWTLELVGPSENGHREELEAQARELGLDGAVVFSGPVDDADKWHKYATADLFVLPTHSENFGIVVAEALAAEVPVLTTTGTPWPELATHECGWWVAPEPEAIRDTLATALRQSDASRTAMGRRGRELVTSTYTWRAVGRRMAQAYEWLLDGDSDCPRFIQRQE
ncbi:glycosyltransferase [Salinibacter ruber]|uniref:Glycosyltransferase involved in cell wall biosynthesis n=1 Tax=Salinibacter ruber TaxID=146919 RepID=A0A9X2Q5R4_9BACT|nr:glycosyltransferase [Salinibacter ruber]MCS3662350.1 glycosyltransferase involved in cell wall biosynthesis [Salinibacter ruber]MCS3712142.1 glycosyltransferase involved in cell wall biosynthesis [Salinibacter ruber]